MLPISTFDPTTTYYDLFKTFTTSPISALNDLVFGSLRGLGFYDKTDEPAGCLTFASMFQGLCVCVCVYACLRTCVYMPAHNAGGMGV